MKWDFVPQITNVSQQPSPKSNRPTPSSTLIVYATTARLPRQDCREADQDIRREVRGCVWHGYVICWIATWTDCP